MRFLDEAKLSVQRALLGEITPEMRVVTVEVSGRQIWIRVYHEGEASEEMQEDLDAATTEVYAEFPGEGPDAVTVELELVRNDQAGPFPVLGWPVFARKETGALDSPTSAV